MNRQILNTLRCPMSGEPLEYRDGYLISQTGTYKYRITASGIPLFAEKFVCDDGLIQQKHYDKVSSDYLRNLSYQHTQEYTAYLDGALLQEIDASLLGRVAEICCGRGEAFYLLRGCVGNGVGIDVSLSMLEEARRTLTEDKFTFAQGDATMLPLSDAQFDSVFILGGIHHINNREKFLGEIFRILKPGGKFFWREPVDDFFVWRWLRAIIYKLSPNLDEKSEHPLRHQETVSMLEKVGFSVRTWKTYGFLGYCFFMNSDILIFNKLFHFIPGIGKITKMATKIDDFILKLPCFARLGAQVIGVARKG